jgi:N6-adenosine-specific RNA methylase IME4
MRYGTIVADPPWRYTQKPTERTGAGVSAEHAYPTLTTEEIARLGVGALADEQAHLYMWVTNPVLLGMRQTIMGGIGPSDIARAWGFEPKALLTWVKGENGAGMGWYFRGDTEHVLFAVRGDLPIPAEKRISNVFRGRRGAHSAKPDSFLDCVEQVSPGPYVELFSRRARFGWDYWGDESLGTAVMG